MHTFKSLACTIRVQGLVTMGDNEDQVESGGSGRYSGHVIYFLSVHIPW